MATPIKVTPTLSNATSKKFNERLKQQKNVKVSSAERERVLSLVDKILSKSKHYNH